MDYVWLGGEDRGLMSSDPDPTEADARYSDGYVWLGPGVAHHKTHGERVQTAHSAASISTWFGVAAVLLLAVFAWLVLRCRSAGAASTSRVGEGPARSYDPPAESGGVGA